MGSGKSKAISNNVEFSSHGQIYMRTSQFEYKEGDTVTGEIYLNLTEAFPGNEVFLRIKGKESAVYYEIIRSGEHTTYRRIHYKETFIKEDNSIKTFDRLGPGQYVIPFAFLLPKDLPPSTYQIGAWYYLHMHYKVQVFIKNNDPKGQNLKKTQIILINKPLTNPQTNIYKELTTNLRVCGCCPCGSNLLKVNYEKDFYTLGETARCVMKLDNGNSRLNNLSIVFSLKQIVHFNFAKKDARWYTNRKVLEHRPGAKAREGVVERNMEIILPNSLPSFDTFPILDVEKFPLGHEMTSFTENHSIINPATNGAVIKINYFLEVECLMRGYDCCCGKFPLIDLPVQIYFPTFGLPPPALYCPVGWNPQVLQPVNLAMVNDPQQPHQISQIMPMDSPHMMVNANMINVQSPKPQNMEFAQNLYSGHQ